MFSDLLECLTNPVKPTRWAFLAPHVTSLIMKIYWCHFFLRGQSERWFWSLLKVEVKRSRLWSNKWALWSEGGIVVLSQQTCDFLSGFFPPWSCFCLIVFLSWSNSGALACSFPDLCLLVIHFHQPKLPWVMWSATCSLLRCSTAQLDHRLSLVMLSSTALLCC